VSCPRPEPETSPKSAPDLGADSDTARTDKSDDADTDPLPALNPFGPGWGAGWGSSWGSPALPDTTPRPESVERSSRAASVGRHERPLMGDVELPAAPEPFAFPTATSGPARGGWGRVALIGVGTLAVLAAVGSLIFWLTDRSPSNPESANATTTHSATTTTEPPRRNVEAETRLMRMLPPGYPPGACRPVDPAPGSVATFSCDSNSDPGGPTSATYLLARDKAALDAAFTAAVRPDSVVTCPGNIQSPGSWRRNATPQQISGTLVCGVQGDVPTVAWTDEERMSVSIVRSNPPGPSLDQLYQWWSSHS
jgi:serine/threonine kinase PknH